MNMEIKKYMYLMKSGQISEEEVSKKLSISICEVRITFAKYNKRIKRNKKLKKIAKEIICTLDIDFIIRLFKD